MRKQIFNSSLSEPTPLAKTGELDIATIATVLVTSEDPEYPIENIFDQKRGVGGSRWRAADSEENGKEQTVILAFDTPQRIERMTLEIEELAISRTQELHLAVSRDGGKTYQELLRQEYNFSPPGTTFEQEKWTLNAEGVTHLRLGIKPDKSKAHGRATLTSLVLYPG